MERFRLARKRWPLLAAFALTAAVELTLFLAVTRGALAGEPVGGGWSGWSIAGWHVFIALCGLGVAWQPLVEWRTKYDAEGIHRPQFLKPPFVLRWEEALNVFIAAPKGVPHFVRVNGTRGSVHINALHYKDPEALLALIGERMSASLGEGKGAAPPPPCDARPEARAVKN